MFITKTKTKNDTIYYLNKSYRNHSGKGTSSKIVEKIGTKKEIQKKIGKNKNVDMWAKKYAAKKTEEEKKRRHENTFTLNPSSKLKANYRRVYNAGYLIIRKICIEIGLHKILESIAKKEKFKGDLFQIITYMIYTHQCNNIRPIYDTFSLSKTLIEQPKFNKRQLYNAIELLAKHDFNIQIELLDSIENCITRKHNVFFYDANTFFHDFTNKDEDFELQNENEQVIKYELSLDSNNIPIGYSIYSNQNIYKDEEIKMDELLHEKFDHAATIALSDFTNPNTSEISSERLHNASVIQILPLNKCNENIQQWAMDKDGWTEISTNKTYNIDNVKSKINNPNTSSENANWLKSTRFYKTKKVKYTNSKTGETKEQIIVVVFGYEIWQDKIKKHKEQIENIKKNIDAELFKHSDDLDYCIKYLDKYSRYINIVDNISIDNKTNIFHLYNFNNDVLNKQTVFAGFYSFKLDAKNKNIADIIKIQSNKWINDRTFKVIDNDFFFLPKYIQYKDRIFAHFIITYLALTVWRILLMKSNWKYTDTQLINVLLNMNFINIPGEGWIPAYESNEITKFIHKILGFYTDYEFIPYDIMNKWIKSTYKKEGKNKKKN